MFKIEIKTDGSAFCDQDGEESEFCKILEVSRILKEIQHKLMEYNHTSGSCMDLNGNKVGSWKLD